MAITTHGGTTDAADKPAGVVPIVSSELVRQLRDYINKTPALISILYDMDLLPEQVSEGSIDHRRMIILAAWWQSINDKLPNARISDPANPKRHDTK